MLRKLEFTKKTIPIENYDEARAALCQALAITKLLEASCTLIDDPKCLSVTAGVLGDLLEKIEHQLGGGACGEPGLDA